MPMIDLRPSVTVDTRAVLHECWRHTSEQIMRKKEGAAATSIVTKALMCQPKVNYSTVQTRNSILPKP